MMRPVQGILMLAMGIGALSEPLPFSLITRQGGSGFTASPVTDAHPPSPAKRDMAAIPATPSTTTTTIYVAATENALSVLRAAVTKNDTAGPFGQSSSSATSTNSIGPAMDGVGKFAAAPQESGTSATTLAATPAGSDLSNGKSAATPTNTHNGMPSNTDAPKPAQYMALGTIHNIETTIVTTITVPASTPSTLTTTITVSPTPTPTEKQVGCILDSVKHIGPDGIIRQDQYSCGDILPTSIAPSATSPPTIGSTSTSAATNSTSTTTSPSTTPAPTTTTTTEENGFVDWVTSGVVHAATGIKDVFAPNATAKPSTAGAARLAPIPMFKW